MKHTPGPWKKSDHTSPVFGSNGDLMDERLIIYSESSSKIIAAVGGLYDKKTQANADLIISAPDMLAVLKGAASAIRKALPLVEGETDARQSALTYCGEWLGEIDEVIRKAEGAE